MAPPAPRPHHIDPFRLLAEARERLASADPGTWRQGVALARRAADTWLPAARALYADAVLGPDPAQGPDAPPGFAPEEVAAAIAHREAARRAPAEPSEAAALAGDGWSQFLLGLRCHQGLTGPWDPEGAASWWGLAADQGHELAAWPPPTAGTPTRPARAASKRRTASRRCWTLSWMPRRAYWPNCLNASLAWPG